ncbi:hypothetical protein TIFTF001_017236 [Ficus carica]|uniref:Ubiquitin-like protease family profile domain-containing protein n=1 Tax=Ficus carica TaxID=3494 RepID=A0AA88D6U1_FICCA|nr:hypothetical protein TIFTF001_017236 [Ficus carica]
MKKIRAVAGGEITVALVQIVDDLDRCRTFPWGRRSYHYLLIHVQNLNLAEKSANAFKKKKTTWACPGFILPLMLLPFECISALTPKFAMVQKDVIELMPRIYQWKMNFKMKKAPTLKDVLQRDIRSILITTPREQETAYMRRFAPDDDESDAIIDQWTIILENELSSIFWENIWYADLEGHRNVLCLHVSTEEVQWEDPTEVENIRHDNASPLVDDPRVLHKLKALEEKIGKMDREVKSHYSQLEKIMTERLDKMMNIIKRLVPQQSTWVGGGSRGGDRVASEGVSFENGRDVNIMASGNEDVGIENDEGFENVRDGDVNIDNTELNVQLRDVRDSVDVGVENYEGVGVENGEGIGVENDRDIGFQDSGGGVIENCENGGDNLNDTEMNVLYSHSPISSNDYANEEDVSEVEQPERRTQSRLMKSKYRRTLYTTPGIKKMTYKQNNEITSGLGCTRNWEFFHQILTPNIWLFTEHMEEVIYGLRRRQHKYSDIINQNAVVLDEVFGQLLVSNSYDSDVIDDYLRKYINGKVSKMRKSWKGTKALYFPFNVGEKENLQNNHLRGGKHWFTVKVDLVELELVVFDCNIGCYNKIQMDKFMKPIKKMIPLMLRESGFFNDLINHLNTPWPYRRPCDHLQNISGDCDMYAIKYIEFDVEGIELNLINDDMIEFYRKKMTIKIFHNHWVP